MRRHKLNKHRSARQFRESSRLTKAANIRNMPMRGGWRL